MRAIVLPAALMVTALAGSAASQTSPVPTSMPEGGAPPPAPTASPVPTTSGEEFPDDTEVVRKALASVSYKNCGTGGPGKLLITFQTDGTVERVVLAEGTWDPNVAVCVTRRFMEAKIEPFTGAPRTVKWSVALAGGPQPAATYAAPPTYGPPSYAYPPGRFIPVLPADDGPPPAGYHREERHRVGALVSGSIISAMGLLFLALSTDNDGYNSDQSTYQIFSIAHLAVGIPLFCVGLTKRSVFAANSASVSLAPAVTKTGASFGLAVTF